jgi:predicted metal-dependent phosphoesterase TrpH
VAFDLHTHTTHSDGTTTPAENAVLASAAGLSGFALTDHDTTAGWAEAEAACAEHGSAFVPGLELSTREGELSLHVLGYWVDPDHAELAAECNRLRHERTDRGEKMCARLAELGVAIDPERLAAIAGSAPVGRPHVAEALVEAGAVADVDAAFRDYIGNDGPAYVPKHALAPDAGVALIVAAGGAAVIAHPARSSNGGKLDRAMLDRCQAAGLAGIETEHPSHSQDERLAWRRTAASRGLVTTGASDYHGAHKAVGLGAETTSRPDLAALAYLAKNGYDYTEEDDRYTESADRPVGKGVAAW